MSIETLVRPNQSSQSIEQNHGEEAKQKDLLDVADAIAAMEEQFIVAEPDEKNQLLAEKDRLIEELTAENPGFTVLNDIINLASIYHRRTTESILPMDGSRIKAFGCRDKFNQYLEETYILHEKPDGGFHYVVRHLTGNSELIFELDDQAEMRIARHGKKYSPSRGQLTDLLPDGEEYQAAVHNLLETTLRAVGEVRKRNDEGVKAGADLRALHMIEDSSFARRFLTAGSSAEVMRKVDSIMAVEPLVLGREALAKIVKAA